MKQEHQAAGRGRYDQRVATTRIYYPLRANAYGIVRGAQLAAFERRLKLSALLHDEVILDDGYWIGQAGPRGSSEMRIPRDDPSWPGLQTPRERSGVVGQVFELLVDGHRVLASPTTVQWRASFEPIKRSLPSTFAWMHFVRYELPSEDKRLAKKIADEDLRDGMLAARLPDIWSRKLAATGASLGFTLATRMGAAVSMDSLHGEVVTARVRRGVAGYAHGRRALLVSVPNVARWGWRDIDEVRKTRGLPDLRAVLADIETQARQAATTGSAVDRAIVQEFDERLFRAMEKLHPNLRTVGTSTVISALVSLATGNLGPAAFAAGTGLGALVEGGRMLKARYDFGNSWVAATNKLRRYPDRDRPVP